MRSLVTRRLRRLILIGTLQISLLGAIAGSGAVALASSPGQGGGGTGCPPSGCGQGGPPPPPRTLPTAPYAYKVCVGPNADGTVSQGQSATCTIYASGNAQYITGDEITIARMSASPIWSVTACAGASTFWYMTSAGSATTANLCSFHVVTGRISNGNVIGTEVISIPNTLASGTAIQQGVIFCAVPSQNHAFSCSNNDTAMPIQVTGPAATVVDEIPPTFTSVPPDMTLDATSPAGAVGIYVLPTATDNAPGPVTVGCSPASSSTFAIGETTVMCTATDAARNTATETFQVTVINTLDSLSRVTAAAVDKPGIAHSLGAKLDAAIAAAAASDTSAMNGSLNAYINEVEAQSGKAIDAQTATDLEGLAALLMT